jgi:hypothetical protein
MKTEQVTLTVAHDENDRLGSASGWEWQTMVDATIGQDSESPVEVRVVEQPRGWLTEEERELIAGITDDDEYTEEGQNIAKGILARNAPPRVRLPEPPFARSNVAHGDWMMCIEAVRKSLAAAGVEVGE